MCSFFGVLVVKESLDEHASASFIDEHVVRVEYVRLPELRGVAVVPSGDWDGMDPPHSPRRQRAQPPREQPQERVTQIQPARLQSGPL